MRHSARAIAFSAIATASLLAQKQDASAPRFEYFDPPAFIVAGVTDYNNHGGHGSDAVIRSADALAKATSSLGARSAATQEKDPVATLRAYQQAAEADSTEPHIFDLGAELLTHHNAEQAADIFSRGAKLFPHSLRMLLGCASAFYSRGLWDEAAKWFFAATDINPNDPTPYLFLGKVQSSEISDSAGYAQRMERFARLQPGNPWANYYYAASLAKEAASQAKAQSLLEKAVRLDPHFALAWLQLGILFASTGGFSRAVAAWQNAIAFDPELEEAHYRLAQTYRRLDQMDKANAELVLCRQLSKRSAERSERERAQNKLFVFSPQ